MTARTYVAVLYSIILGGGRRLVMADLKAMASELGLGSPRTIVATGNLIFTAEEGNEAALEDALETRFKATFSKHIDIIVRRAEDWAALIEGNPFVEEAEAKGASVHVRVMRDRFKAEVAESIQQMARNGERIALVNGDLWMHFPNGVAGTKLLPAMSPKKHGVGTTRNWNTVRRIADALAQ